MQNYLILDIGKTRVKLQIIDSLYKIHESFDKYNIIKDTYFYPSVDIHSIWLWFLKLLRRVVISYKISAINVSTHGATVVLVNKCYSLSGLTLPVLDYEWNGIESELDYVNNRPEFDETFSPYLPAGLNIASQLFWLENNFPMTFHKSSNILLYPQYWTWRLTGLFLSEITSLGCHSDLWHIKRSKYSSLVKLKKWNKKFPPLCPAKNPVGYVSNIFAKYSTINPSCIVYTGLHDSNANFLRYIRQKESIKYTIISSGTWIIVFSPSSKTEHLIKNKDMLSNVNAYGESVPCVRFMGGREFDIICRKVGTKTTAKINEANIQSIINNKIIAIPDFSIGSGPFSGRKNQILNYANNGLALATLYVALMLNYALDLLKSKNDIIIEGVLAKNRLLCSIISQLRSNNSVFKSLDTNGTIFGSGNLCMFSEKHNELLNNNVKSLPSKLKNYLPIILFGNIYLIYQIRNNLTLLH
jgi:sugar (pentulose or hexulose) kinase